MLGSFMFSWCLHLLFTPGHGGAWSPAFHPFKSENSAGRIKIKELGRILLHGSLPGVLFSCLDF